jgi:PAP2 superfamily
VSVEGPEAMELARAGELPLSSGAAGLAMRTLRLAFCHFWLKSLGTAGFMILFFRAYFYLLRHPSGPVTTMSLTPIDHWIGFQPWALPLYLSLWVYVSLPVAFMSTSRDIVRYGWRIGLLCVAGLAIFYVWPTRVPPLMLDPSVYPGFSLLKGLDAAGNACPSLHVATAVFSAIWLDRMLPGLGFGIRMRILNAGWCIAIVYSTMATGQHVALDALGGIVLGVCGAWLSLLGGAPVPFRNESSKVQIP